MATSTIRLTSMTCPPHIRRLEPLDQGHDLGDASGILHCPADNQLTVCQNQSRGPGSEALLGAWVTGGGETRRVVVDSVRRTGQNEPLVDFVRAGSISEWGTRRPVSRILSTDDHLSEAHRCRCAHATYPGASREQRSGGVRSRPWGRPSWSCSEWGLPSHPSHLGCWWSLTPPFHPYLSPGGLFSVALSRGSPRVGVTHHPALWSPDFPQLLLAAIIWPSRPGTSVADPLRRPAPPGTRGVSWPSPRTVGSGPLDGSAGSTPGRTGASRPSPPAGSRTASPSAPGPQRAARRRPPHRHSRPGRAARRRGRPSTPRRCRWCRTGRSRWRGRPRRGSPVAQVDRARGGGEHQRAGRPLSRWKMRELRLRERAFRHRQMPGGLDKRGELSIRDRCGGQLEGSHRAGASSG